MTIQTVTLHSFVAETNRSALTVLCSVVTLRLQPNLQFINYWNTKHYFGSISRNEDFLWRMVCSIVFFDHLETSNAEMDLRNTFSSKFYVDPCLADIFFKVILRRKLKIEKRTDFFSKKRIKSLKSRLT